MTPGPSEVHPEILALLARPQLLHYGAEWGSFYRETCESLKPLFGTDGQPMLLFGSGSLAMELGIANALKPGDEVSVGDIRVEAVEAYNYKRFRSPGHPFHPKGFGVGYLVTTGEKTIYHAGDTDFIQEMRNLRNVYLALLPSGGTYTMDNPEAAEAALAIKPEFVIPMHRWNTNPNEFKKGVEAKSKLKVILLKPGEEFKAE